MEPVYPIIAQCDPWTVVFLVVIWTFVSIAVSTPSFEWEKMPDKLRKLDDGGTSALSSYIYIDGEFRIFCNDRFSDEFMTAKECNDRMREERAMPVFVWSK